MHVQTAGSAVNKPLPLRVSSASMARTNRDGDEQGRGRAAEHESRQVRRVLGRLQRELRAAAPALTRGHTHTCNDSRLATASHTARAAVVEPDGCGVSGIRRRPSVVDGAPNRCADQLHRCGRRLGR